jgi:glycosyltransferase involved in cell wall biosynthesis
MFLMEQFAATYFDAIITADHGVADIYTKDYKANFVQVIHNYPRLDLFLDKNHSSLDTSKTVDLVYHGSIPRYHLEVAFKVASELKDRGHDVTWLFFGSGASPKWVEEQLEKHNLQDVFTYDPNRIPHEQVARRIRQARIGFIPLPDLPKFQHNIPTKLFEYMALRIPIVMSDLPPSRPFVGDGQVALMIPPDDYCAYADAIIRLLNDDKLRESMGWEGYQRVIAQYNWQSESVHLIQLYQTILDG